LPTPSTDTSRSLIISCERIGKGYHALILSMIIGTETRNSVHAIARVTNVMIPTVKNNQGSESAPLSMRSLVPINNGLTGLSVTNKE